MNAKLCWLFLTCGFKGCWQFVRTRKNCLLNVGHQNHASHMARPPLHPHPNLVFPFKRGKVGSEADVSFVWPHHIRTLWQGSAARKSDWGFLWAPWCFLLEERDQSCSPGALVTFQVGTHFMWSLKFQLVAGSPLPVPGCWVTALYLTSLRCLHLGGKCPERLRPMADKTGLPYGAKETECSNPGLSQDAAEHQAYDSLNVTCVFYECFSPFPSASHPLSFISQLFTPGGRRGDISICIYLRLLQLLDPKQHSFPHPASFLFSYLWEMCCYNNPDF